MEKIPIVIGVSGHKNLRNLDIEELEELVRTELKKIAKKCPNSRLLMLNSLAKGADQLCAKIALELGIDLICPLPRELESYRKDFSSEALKHFNYYIANSKEYFAVSPIEPVPNINSLSQDDGFHILRDFGYRQAGIYIAKHSHVLLALHDGEKSIENGCGTAETVDFMKYLDFDDVNGSCFKRFSEKLVIRIRTPSEKNPKIKNPLKVEIVDENNNLDELLKNTEELLKNTDEFNKDIEKHPDLKSKPLIDEDILKNLKDKTLKLDTFHAHAGKLSGMFKDRYMKILLLFSIFAVSVAISFMVYDEVKSNIGLIFYPIIFIIAIGFLQFSKKRGYHRKYLEYRVFAECLRVQFYLTLLNIDHNICENYTWSQKNEAPWIHDAVSALLIGEFKREDVSVNKVKDEWIVGQLKYHKKKFPEVKKQEQKHSNITKTMIILSVGLGFSMWFLEYFFNPFLSFSFPVEHIKNMILLQKGQSVIVRDLFKMFFISFSTATIFLANYYGKLSLKRKAFDHDNMIMLYKSAQTKLSKNELNRDDIFIELAREEILETGNWLSYSRDNTPDINI
ncbi:MAG: hypothetical protein FWH29_00220 [Methanobrevibacter sp.]|nr:hypothetical protein [Methanobrevibacter sp.]